MTTASLSPALRERLGKLLLMLSSDHAGEQSAAAVAIGITLQNHGRSWHDLVGQLFSEPPSPPPQPHNRGRDPEHDNLPTVMSGDKAARLISAIFESGCGLTLRSREFLATLSERAQRYEQVFLSAKQCKWLRDLALTAHAKTQRAREQERGKIK